MKQIVLFQLTVQLFLLLQTSFSLLNPCSQIIIQNELEALPCSIYDQNYEDSSKYKQLNSYVDVATVQKLSFSGWRYIHYFPPNNVDLDIFGIAQKELNTNQQIRPYILQIKGKSNLTMQQCLEPDCTSLQIISLNQTKVEELFRSWIFVIGSVDLSAQIHSAYIIAGEKGLEYFASLSSSQWFSTFPVNILINYGYTSTTIDQISSKFSAGGGCGFAKNIKLYPNFTFTDASQINPRQFMRSEANYQFIYSMTARGAVSFLVDESGKNNHAFLSGDVAKDPQLQSASFNEGLLITMNKHLVLPQPYFTHGEIMLSFWLNVMQAGNYIILRMDSAEPVLKIKSYDSGSSLMKIGLVFAQDINYNITQPISFSVNVWYFFFLGCNNYPGTAQYICNYTVAGNNIGPFHTDLATIQGFNLTNNNFSLSVGDASNPLSTSFLLKQLELADGAMFSRKDATSNCMSNCELQLAQQVQLTQQPSQRCLLCSAGYLLQYNGQCIAAASCLMQDPDIAKCRVQPSFCQSELRMAPSCDTCASLFAVSQSTDCVACKYKCSTCDSNGECLTCDASRNQDPPACTCQAPAFDDRVQQQCVSPISNILPSKVLNKILTVKSFSMATKQCQSITEPSQNMFTFSDLALNDLTVLGSNKISFSLWFQPVSVTDSHTVFILAGGGSSANKTETRVLQMLILSNLTMTQITQQVTTEKNYTSVQIQTSDWIWGLFSIDLQAVEISYAMYRSGYQRWAFDKWSGIYSTISNDVILYFGNMAIQAANHCTFVGSFYENIFFYFKITAKSINFNIELLQQIMKQAPDYIFLTYKVPTDNSKPQEFVDQSGLNNGNAVMGASLATEPLYDASTHWYQGFILNQSSFITLPNFLLDEYVVQYWWTKGNVDLSFYAFLRKNQSGSRLVSIQHVANPVLKSYSLQVCIKALCQLLPYTMKLEQWHFVAVSITNNRVNQYIADVYINNYKKRVKWTVQSLSSLSFSNDITTIGGGNGGSADPYYIKNFTVNAGGALFGIDQGIQGLISKCLLSTIKSNNTASPFQCLLCDWGFYVGEGGVCVAGLEYCDLKWQKCVPQCLGGQYLNLQTLQCTSKCSSGLWTDNLLMQCVNNCSSNQYADTRDGVCYSQCQLPYYGNPLTMLCTPGCPPNYFFNDQSATCTQTCQNGVYADPVTLKCECVCSDTYFADSSTNTCKKQCPQGTLANPPTKTCSTGCSVGYFADNNAGVCVTLCPVNYFADSLSRNCTLTCPSGYYKEQTTRKCYDSCPIGKFEDALAGVCSATCSNSQFSDIITNKCTFLCSNGYFGDPTLGQCSQNCSSGFFSDSVTRLCATTCSVGLFRDKALSKCVSQCSLGFYSDPVSGNCSTSCQSGTYYTDQILRQCALTCSSGLYADPTTFQCSPSCPSGLFADQTTHFCVANCPSGYTNNPILNLCVSQCSSGTFNNPLTNTCDGTCPANYYADSDINTCVPYESSCADKQCLHPVKHRCVGLDASQSFYGRQNQTYWCVDLNQPVGVDYCIETIDQDFCIDTSSQPKSQCIQLQNRSINNSLQQVGAQQNAFCQCLQNQCRENNGQDRYSCQNLSSNVTERRVGREKNTQLCLQENNNGTYGATRCAENYCIDEATASCTFMDPTNSSTLARVSGNHSCIRLNQKVDVDWCAEGNYCIDQNSVTPSQCIYLEGRSIVDDNSKNICKCSKLQCIAYIPSNDSYQCTDVNSSDPERVGIERNTAYCLTENYRGAHDLGASYCTRNFCIDQSNSTCIRLSRLGHQGRKLKDMFCVNASQQVGVEECAQDAFCIDLLQSPSQCLDLQILSTCYTGVEKETQVCAMAYSTGSKNKGINYCKTGYCIATSGPGTGPSSCRQLSAIYLAKDQQTLCQEPEQPGMIECGPGYCLNVTDNSCIKIKGEIFGKDLKTSLCIMDRLQGATQISECADGYCKTNNEADGLWYCVQLDPNVKDHIGKEKETHNCLSYNDLTQLGILECATTFCPAEVITKSFQCVNSVKLNNMILAGINFEDAQLKNVQQCQQVEMTNMTFAASSIKRSQLFRLSNCSGILVDGLVFDGINLEEESSAIHITNAENMTISGEIHIANTRIAKGSYLLYVKNSSINFQAHMIFENVQVIDHSELVHVENVSNVAFESVIVHNITIQQNSHFFTFIATKQEAIDQRVHNVNISNINLVDYSALVYMRDLITSLGNNNIFLLSSFTVRNATLINNSMLMDINVKNVNYVMKDTAYINVTLTDQSAGIMMINTLNIVLQDTFVLQQLELNRASVFIYADNSVLTFNASQLFNHISIVQNSNLFYMNNAVLFNNYEQNLDNVTARDNSTVYKMSLPVSFLIALTERISADLLTLVENSCFFEIKQFHLVPSTTQQQFEITKLIFNNVLVNDSSLINVYNLGSFAINTLNISNLVNSLESSSSQMQATMITALIMITNTTTFNISRLSVSQSQMNNKNSFIYQKYGANTSFYNILVDTCTSQASALFSFYQIGDISIDNLKVLNTSILQHQSSIYKTNQNIFIVSQFKSAVIGNISYKANDTIESSLQSNLKPPATALLTITNGELVNLASQGQIYLEVSQYQQNFMLASIINVTKDATLANLQISNQFFHNPDQPFIYMQEVNNKAQLANISMQNLTINVGESDNFILIFNVKQLQIISSQLGQISLTGPFIKIQKAMQLQISLLAIENLTNSGDIHKNDFYFIVCQSNQQQSIQHVNFSNSVNVALLNSQPFTLKQSFVNSSNTQSHKHLEIQIKQDSVILENVAANNCSLRDTSLASIQSNNLTIQSSTINSVSCSHCNGSALNIQLSNISITNLSANGNSAGFYGGALYTKNCIKEINLINSSFLNNKASLAGGAIFLDSTQFDMKQNIIQNNSAMIGGGLLFLNLVPRFLMRSQLRMKSLQSLDNISLANTIINNKASLYGQNVATHVGMISLLKSRTQDQSKLQILENQNPQLYSETIQISNIRSGYLLNVTLLPQMIDYYSQEPVNLTVENWNQLMNLTNNNTPTNQLIAEISKIHLDFSFNSIDNTIDGDLEKNFLSDFNFNSTQSFVYGATDINILGYPGKAGQFIINAHNIMQPNFDTGMFQETTSSIQVIIQFRECQKGEIYQKNLQYYECYECPEGRYSLAQPYITSMQICQSCPFEYASQCFKNQIQLRQGYWRKNTDSDLIVNCQNQEENCEGGFKVGDQSCFQGHSGALCEQCDIEGKIWGESYAKTSKFSCVKCSEIANNSVFIVISLLYTFASIGLSIKSGIDEQKKQMYQEQLYNVKRSKVFAIDKMDPSSSKMQSKSRKIVEGNDGTVYIKILTTYLQIVSCIATFQLSFDTTFFDAPNTVGQPISQSSNSFECFLKQHVQDPAMSMHYVRLMISLGLSLFYFIGFLLLYGIYSILLRLKFKSYVVTTSFSFLVLLLQPDLVSYMISILSCRTIGDTPYVLGNVNYECYTDEYITYSLSFVLPSLLIWAMALPLIQVFMLYKNKDRLDKADLQLKFGFLYKEYQVKHYYWEFVKMYQKILIIIILNYYSQDVKTKGILIFVIIIVYLVLSIQQVPYKRQHITSTDALSSKICAITILTAVFISQIVYEYFLILGMVFIIVVNLYYIISLLNLIISSFSNKFQDKIDTIKLKLIAKFPNLKFFLKVSKERIVKEAWLKVKEYLKKHKGQLNKLQEAIAVASAQKNTQNQQQEQLIQKEILQVNNLVLINNHESELLDNQKSAKNGLDVGISNAQKPLNSEQQQQQQVEDQDKKLDAAADQDNQSQLINLQDIENGSQQQMDNKPDGNYQSDTPQNQSSTIIVKKRQRKTKANGSQSRFSQQQIQDEQKLQQQVQSPESNNNLYATNQDLVIQYEPYINQSQQNQDNKQFQFESPTNELISLGVIKQNKSDIEQLDKEK